MLTRIKVIEIVTKIDLFTPHALLLSLLVVLNKDIALQNEDGANVGPITAKEVKGIVLDQLDLFKIPEPFLNL